MLTDGFHNVPAGKLAMVVTHLEMRSRADMRDITTPQGITLRHINKPDSDWYRDLFFRVGGRDYLWFSRLEMSDTDLRVILDDPQVEVWAIEKNGVAEGLLELDLREDRACELAFFGLTQALVGSGIGRWLMNHAITRAWSHPIDRFHVHTCTLDSPQALGFYCRSGFTPIKQQIEISPDFRLSGGLPRDAGQHVPIFE
jgi:GNAT superfamily N-acetyltransferase